MCGNAGGERHPWHRRKSGEERKQPSGFGVSGRSLPSVHFTDLCKTRKPGLGLEGKYIELWGVLLDRRNWSEGLNTILHKT